MQREGKSMSVLLNKVKLDEKQKKGEGLGCLQAGGDVI